MAFTVAMLKLLNWHTFTFRQFQKNVVASILRLFQMQQAQTHVQNLIWFRLSKCKALYKQDFLRYAFQLKI